MPLILLTGVPSSGKSTLAQEISQYFQDRQHQVKIVSDSEILDWDGRDAVYSSISKEKELRGWLKAEALRYLNRNYIIILDAASYIKGYRYEIYCMVKETKTQYCVIEKLVDTETCWAWNETRENKYSRSTFDAIVFRYEKCDENNRWDSPLLRLDDKSKLDMDCLYNIIINNQPLVSNKSTSLSTTTTTIFKPSK